ncbi:restriction endonuclease subunit S [Pasteurella bettyae]|uniref:Type I restriction modification DNA specificity domain protein n=1 Tax=Pasteurella bettyae CCUG 2042 TaxID=1095749 RepID=I3DIA0_9PAST|nr:restriction endonuclease subunit S [Pasteurella bettyae]EIJ71443.1 type I restriction modification DNA specificity domain protein [Pasteurella bettyae CCUG 2042]
MNKLNISGWKEFVIGKLFEIKRPDSRSIKQYEDGSVPFVSSGNFNNGIDKFVTPFSDECLDRGNCITISPVDGSCFYQPTDFLGRGGGGSSIILLYNDNLNEKNGMFISTILRKTLSRLYEYNDMGSSNSIKQEKIKLPATANNQPDWEYMENYIKRLYFIKRGGISTVVNYVGKPTTKRVDITKWGTFQIGELFEIKKPEVIHSKNVQECNLQNESDSIPYVVRTKFNNGIKCNIIKTSEMQPTISGVISFGAENTVFFYQEKEFVSGRDIYYIDTSYLSKNTCLFLVACLNTITHKYSYNNGLFPDLLRKENISLPITNQNTPDWKYMEDYISCLFQQQNNSLQQLL